ncbi:MAG: multidrug effflux MFS transporter [Microbacteriaceae bacterium]
MNSSTTIAHPGDALSRSQRLGYILILGALTALGPFTIDLYLPAFPQLEQEFMVGPEAIQLTLTGTTIGFALGQLIVGPWSDRVGRRLPLIVANSMHILASIGVAMSTTIDVLNVFRILQGFGAAAGAVVAMAMVRDLFSGRPMVTMISRLALVNGLAPVLAPVIGSQLLLIMDWRGTFYFLMSYGAIVLVCSLIFIKETLLPENRRGGFSAVFAGYKSVLSDHIYLGAMFTGAAMFAGLFAYVASSSFLFQNVFNMNTQEYGWLFAMNSIGIIVGVQTSTRITRWIEPQWILVFSTLGQVIAAGAIIVAFSNGAGLVGVLIPLWFFITFCGFGFPMVQVLALIHHGHEAGTAASLLGSFNFMMAGLVAPLVGMLGVGTPIPMATVMVCSAIVALLSVVLIMRPKSVPRLEG